MRNVTIEEAVGTLLAYVDLGQEFPDAENRVIEEYHLTERERQEVVKRYDNCGGQIDF